MNSTIQILSFLISFVFGIFFYILTSINFSLINNLKKIWQHILTFIYVIDISIIYMIILFHLNKGYFHIYFILTVIIGFICGYFIKTKLISKISVKWENRTRKK